MSLKNVLECLKQKFMVVVGGTFDFRVTPNPNIMLDVNLVVEFDNSLFLKKAGLVMRQVPFDYWEWEEELEVLRMEHIAFGKILI